MHWEKLPSPEQACPRPYQGVRVKDPVKELLQRKRRADLSNSRITPTAWLLHSSVEQVVRDIHLEYLRPIVFARNLSGQLSLQRKRA
ncbi:hypothetical protein COCON_G00190830 [Conger conger]|uniref:OCA domain-containing protein n=1 Tax=Conger conger TaxID=82655 RepID=A0A9Q1D3H7_CONCO|nr:hypothetical protein COCON_G00190830 [Conger conger]